MLKKITVVIFFAVLILIAFLYFNLPAHAPSTDQLANQNQNTLSINGIEIKVEIADDPNEQSQGLSGRESLATDSGMLFIFTQPIMPGFWMKDMKFSLDLIWIDESGKIIEITKNVSPNTYPETFLPPSPIKYVLEVNAGWAYENKIRVGHKVSGL